MSQSHPQKLKLLNILKILYEYTDEQHPISTTQLALMLKERGIECERKSIYRDIESLNEFGIEIMRSTIPRGYYINDRLFEMPELRMLSDSVRFSEFITEKKTNEMIKKLRRLTSVYLAEELDESSGGKGSLKNRNERIYYSIDRLHIAIKSGRKVHFSYYRHVIKDGKPVFQKSHEFKVSPYALIWNDGKYYLVANYEKYDDLSHYRLDRIKEVSILAEKIRPLSEVSEFTNGFDETEYVSRVFEMYAGCAVSKIVLKCDMSCIDNIVEKFGQDIMLNLVDDHFFTVEVSAVINDGFISWLFARRGKISVISPTELVEKVKNLLQEMLADYEL